MATLVPVTEQEMQAGALNEEKLDELRADVREHGYCLLGPVIGEQALERLGPELDLICAGLAAAQVLERARAERSWHLGAGVPRCAPYMRADYVANPLVEHAVAALLGLGRIVASLCPDFVLPLMAHPCHPLHTRFANLLGTSIF
jgi:hypothetical protein